jgi:hypothetical protein
MYIMAQSMNRFTSVYGIYRLLYNIIIHNATFTYFGLRGGISDSRIKYKSYVTVLYIYAVRNIILDT